MTAREEAADKIRSMKPARIDMEDLLLEYILNDLEESDFDGMARVLSDMEEAAESLQERRRVGYKVELVIKFRGDMTLRLLPGANAFDALQGVEATPLKSELDRVFQSCFPNASGEWTVAITGLSRE